MKTCVCCETCYYWVQEETDGWCSNCYSPMWDAPYVRATETCEYWEPIEENEG